MGVDGANLGLDAVVECGETIVQLIAGFIDRIVASNPWIRLVVRGDLLPEPYCTVLEVLVVPECGVFGTAIAVPVGILATWKRMHVENRVYIVLGTLGIY
jgi:hypothetical protein